jgi:hypothetical protein
MTRVLIPALLLAACAQPAPHPLQATAAQPPEPRVIELRNPGFESAPRGQERCAPHWGCTMHNDTDAFRFRLDGIAPARGERSLCIERLKLEPWGLATQGVDAQALRGKRVRFSADIRAEVVDGRGAGPWVQVHGVPLAEGHFERLATRTDGWRRMVVVFPVAASATLVEVGLVLEGGGHACIDEARLEILGPL